MADAATLVAAVLCWLAFGYKLRHLRERAGQPGSAPLRALVWVLGLAAALATVTPVNIGQVIDSFAGLSGLTRLVANVLSMATCLAIAGWLLFLGRDQQEARRRLRIHIRVFGATVAVILVLFALDHPPLTPDRAFAGVYTYVFQMYVTYAVTAQVVISWRYAKVVEAPMLQLGLRIVSLSNVLGIATILVAVTYLLTEDLNLGIPGSPRLFFPLYAVAATLFVIGMTLPAWGPRIGLERVWCGIARRLATRRLHPLWAVITDAYPGVVLDRGLLAASPNGQRLIAERMPVEIHDGWLNLRNYLTQQDIDVTDRLVERRRARGLDRDALLAAARLMIAVGRRSNASRSPATAESAWTLRSGVDASLLADVRFLCATSKRLRSPFVREAVRQLV